MKVVLLFPRFKHRILSEPLGVAYLASELERVGIDVHIIDGTFHTPSKCMEMLKDINPDIVGLSIQTIYAKHAYQLCKKFSRFNKESLIVAGGPHPTILPEQTLSEGEIDLVIVGEGERTMLKVIECVEKNKNFDTVNGVAFKRNGKVIKTAPVNPIIDIDSIQFPARHLLSPKYYKNNLCSIISSRGCPFNCSYCQPTLRKLFGKKPRRRSVNNVIAELYEVKEQFAIKHIIFQDDLFTMNKNWIREFCEELIEEEVDMTWEVTNRADTTPDTDLLMLMKKAGCIRMSIGVESGDDHIRNYVLGKNITQEQIYSTFSKMSQTGMKTEMLLMIGSPEETIRSINNTIKMIGGLMPTSCQVTITTPLPGTELYSKLDESGLLLDHDINNYDYYKNSVIKLGELGPKDVRRCKEALLHSTIVYCIFRKTFKRNIELSTIYSVLYQLPIGVFAVIDTLIRKSGFFYKMYLKLTYG